MDQAQRDGAMGAKSGQAIVAGVCRGWKDLTRNWTPSKLEIKKPDPQLRGSGYRPGNNLLSRDLTSYYHWLLGA